MYVFINKIAKGSWRFSWPENHSRHESNIQDNHDQISKCRQNITNQAETKKILKQSPQIHQNDSESKPQKKKERCQPDAVATLPRGSHGADSRHLIEVFCIWIHSPGGQGNPAAGKARWYHAALSMAAMGTHHGYSAWLTMMNNEIH